MEAKKIMDEVKKLVARTDEDVFVADIWRKRIWGGCMCSITTRIDNDVNYLVEVNDDEDEELQSVPE